MTRFPLRPAIPVRLDDGCSKSNHKSDHKRNHNGNSNSRASGPAVACPG
jgi:hypothetical protein